MVSHLLNMNGVLMGALVGLALCLAFMAAWLRCAGNGTAKRVALLSVLMAAGVLCLRAIPPCPAMNAPSQPRQTVAVFRCGLLGNSTYLPALSLEATQAIVREINRSAHYSVTVPSEDAQNVSAARCISDPTAYAVRSLGRRWGVDAVVAGDILDVSFTEKPRCAHVTLSVRISSVITGVVVNGAIQTGSSRAARTAVDADDAELIRQAVTDAARRAVSTIEAYTLPDAFVLSKSGAEELTLDRGKKDGFIPGLEMIVIRGRDCVGHIRVISTESDIAKAVILDSGKGIRPGDRAQAIFRLCYCSWNVADEAIVTTDAP